MQKVLHLEQKTLKNVLAGIKQSKLFNLFGPTFIWRVIILIEKLPAVGRAVVINLWKASKPSEDFSNSWVASVLGLSLTPMLTIFFFNFAILLISFTSLKDSALISKIFLTYLQNYI